MASVLESGKVRRQPLPRRLAAMMRPELPSLADEIITDIRATIPEYARPLDGPYGRALRTGVQQALTSFVAMVADPEAPRDDLAGVCRRLGRYEAREGRSLDCLQAAYRVGARVAWHRIMELGQRSELSSSVMSLLADAVLDFMDELASQSQHGYLEEKACSAQVQQEWRSRLLGLILERPAPPRRAVEELAARAGWPVPRQVTMVAIAADPDLAGRRLPRELLGELRGRQPHLLIPGPPDGPWEGLLPELLAGCRAVTGLTVPLIAAADSLRWARQVLALAQAGVVGGQLIRCEDHLLPLWLLSDVGLAEQVSKRVLGRLSGLSPLRRRQLTETLTVLLETRGTAIDVAGQLGIHPQTVRYRIRQLEQLLGDGFTDPEARFAMELVLRTARLRQRASWDREDLAR